MSPAVAHSVELPRTHAVPGAAGGADAHKRACGYSYYYYFFADAAEAGDRFTELSFGDAQLTL